MAVHAHSIPAPTVQPLLRAAGPCRVLSDADVIALTADLGVSLASVRDALAQTLTALALHGRAPIDTLELFVGKGHGAGTFVGNSGIETMCTDIGTTEGMAATTMPSEFYDDLVEFTDPRWVSFRGTTPLPPLGVALSRRRDILGAHDGGSDND